jgi:hypothetical protein
LADSSGSFVAECDQLAKRLLEIVESLRPYRFGPLRFDFEHSCTMDVDRLQRGSNENTNGLVRHYFPRGTDFSRISQTYLNAIAVRLNQRPRKTLGFETPADKPQAVLH